MQGSGNVPLDLIPTTEKNYYCFRKEYLSNYLLDSVKCLYTLIDSSETFKKCQMIPSGKRELCVMLHLRNIKSYRKNSQQHQSLKGTE